LVFKVFRGERVDLADIDNCYGNAGSQNWTWGAALAKGIVTGDWSRLEELLDEELSSGLRQAEIGSEKYDPDVLAYRVAALSRIPADHPARPKLVGSLRAYLAYLALCAVPGPRTATIMRRPEAVAADDALRDDFGPYFATDGDARWYQGGVSIATPGHRWHPDSPDQSLLGPMLAWALGFPASYTRRIVECSPDPDVEDDYTWPMGLLRLALGSPGIGYATAPDQWGLGSLERLQLRDVVTLDHAEGPAGVVEAAVAMLSPYGLYGPLVIEVVGTTEGRQARLEHSVNGMKPQIAAAKIVLRGRYEAVVPSRWSRLSAARATTEDRGDRIACFAGEGGPEIDIATIGGRELYRVRWDAQGARLVGAGAPAVEPPRPAATTTPPPAPPVTTTPAPTVKPDLARELAEIADGVQGLQLARRQRPIQREVAEELRVWVDRKARYDKDLRGAGPEEAEPRALSNLADEVAAFGINPDQAQGPGWLALIERLRKLA
jgi:hypothetical protein